MPDAAVATPITTPVTTPSPSTATPATQEGTSAPVTSQRPESFAQAFEQVAAREETTTTAPPDGATIPPAVVPTPASAQPDPKGPIPFDVHHQALANARDKAVAEYREQYGWAEGITPEQLREWNEWGDRARRMSADPIAFLQDFTAQLQSHPTWGPQLRSQAGRILAGGQEPEPAPDVQIVNAEGQVTGMTFSADRLAERDAWRERNLLQKVGQEIAPLKEERNQRIAAEKHAAVEKQVQARTDETLSYIDGFLELENDSPKADRDRLYGFVNDLMATGKSALAAAQEVRKVHVVPSLAEKARLAAIDTQKKKAAGNTANGTGPTATPTRPRTPKELAAWWEQRDRA